MYCVSIKFVLLQHDSKNHIIMKRTVFVALILLVCCRCFGQSKESFTYSVGVAYSQIWLPSYCYGTNEYGVSSSPFNWGVTPYFSVTKGRFVQSYGIGFSSCSRTKEYSSARHNQDKWQEANAVFAVGFRVTGEHSPISVTPFLGMDLSYLINYEKTFYGTWITHYNTDQLGARITDYFFTYFFGLGLLGGIGVSCPIAKQFEIGLSYCFKFKILNNIRDTSYPTLPIDNTSPHFFHTANIGFSYRFN